MPSKPQHKPQARASPATRERIREATTALEIHTEQGAVPNITATLARGDIINRNGRYYSATVLERAAVEARDRAASGQVIGLMDHPGWEHGDKGTPERIVIRWSRLFMDGVDLKGEGTIVTTALGRDLMALKEGGVHIGLSTNAYALAHWENAGDVPAPYDGDENDLIEVIDELELISIDAVNDPSNVFARIHAEAVARRESATQERNMDMNEVEKLKAELATAKAAQEAAEARVTDLEAAALIASEETAMRERSAVVDVITAKHPHLAEAIVTAMRSAAEAAPTVEAAKVAAEAIAEAVPASSNGNNGVPTTEDAPAKAFDPMREYRQN